jgi:hypothetical protein
MVEKQPGVPGVPGVPGWWVEGTTNKVREPWFWQQLPRESLCANQRAVPDCSFPCHRIE